jgi:hypothetical protein
VPTKDEHVKKADENEKLAATMQPSNQASINWKLVILFYTALHYVEAYLAKQMNFHLRSHTTRDGWITKEANLRKVRTEYFHLKFFGYNARYEADSFTAKEVAEALTYLTKVKATIQPLL